MEEIFKQTEMFLKMVLGICVSGVGLKLMLTSNAKIATAKIGKTLGRVSSKKGEERFKLSKQYSISLKRMFEGVFIIGPTREGKSVSTFLNNLLSEKFPKCSKVLADLKGELWDLTHKFRESLGETCLLFEPLGNHAHYNPLDFCNDFTEIRELSQNILTNSLKGDYDKWSEMANALLTAALLYAKSLKYPFNNIPFAVNVLVKNDIDALEKLFKSTRDENIIDQFNIFASCLESKPTGGSIRVTLLSKLSVYMDPKVIKSMSKSDFSPADLRNSLINVYIKYEIGKAEYLAPILAVVYSQLIDRTTYSYVEGKSLPIIYLLDEMQNMGKVPKLHLFVAHCASYQIGLICCCQNLTSLYDIYGENTTITILNCLKTKIILPSISDIKALRYFSELCGFTEIKNYDGKNTNTSKKKLFDEDEIRRLGDNKVIIIAHNKDVLEDMQDIWFKNEECIKNSKVV